MKNWRIILMIVLWSVWGFGMTELVQYTWGFSSPTFNLFLIFVGSLAILLMCLEFAEDIRIELVDTFKSFDGDDIFVFVLFCLMLIILFLTIKFGVLK